MKPRYTTALTLAVSILCPSQPVKAQEAKKPDSPSQVRNLKALSQELTQAQLLVLMASYTKALGVSCSFCHEETTQGQFDYASDANPMKQTARLMIRMTSDINTKYLAQLGDRRYAEPIACGNCHQGQASPPVFEPKQ